MQVLGSPSTCKLSSTCAPGGQESCGAHTGSSATALSAPNKSRREKNRFPSSVQTVLLRMQAVAVAMFASLNVLAGHAWHKYLLAGSLNIPAGHMVSLKGSGARSGCSYTQLLLELSRLGANLITAASHR